MNPKQLISALLLSSLGSALSIDTKSTDSICSLASTVAEGLMDYYSGSSKDGTVGYFDGPYYWWEYLELFHALLDYTYVCGDDQFKDDIRTGMVSQLGSGNDFLPAAQRTNIGNDDQTWWGLLALNAHSYSLEAPSDSFSWLDAAKNVYKEVSKRWDSNSCSGGIRWQILSNHSGYDYKNSISNGNLMLMLLQLHVITGESEYLDMLEKVWNWIIEVGFVKDGSKGYSVYDGADVTDNCGTLDETEWSYNYGTFLGALSHLYNSTGEEKYGNHTLEMINGLDVFFNDDAVMYEKVCQPDDTCNEDERCFKSVLARNLASLGQLYPAIQSTVSDYLTASAKGAAQSCSGGSDGVTCGMNWFASGWDGKYGLGEQMSALAVMVALVE